MYTHDDEAIDLTAFARVLATSTLSTGSAFDEPEISTEPEPGTDAQPRL